MVPVLGKIDAGLGGERTLSAELVAENQAQDAS